MTVLDLKLVRELIAARGMLAAIIAIVATGITCFVMMGTLYYNLDYSRQSYYTQCRMADFWVQFKKMPLSEVARLAEVEGITELRPRIQFPVVVDIDESLRPMSGIVLSLPEHDTPVINDIILKRGTYFTSGHRAEVIVNEAFARAHGLRPGDSIHLLLNNRRQQLLIVGTAISSEYVYLLGPGGLIPDPESFGVFYVKQRFAEDAFDFQGACNELVGLLAPSRRSRPETVLQQLEQKLEAYGVADAIPRSRQSSHWFLSTEIYGLKINAFIMPTVFLVVAALILNILMTRMAEQQRTIVGTLKALGYSNRLILIHFMKFSAAVGLIGGVLGSLFGYLFAGLMTTKVYSQFFEFPELITRFYPGVVSAGLGISLACSVLGAFRGVRSVVQLAPATAMRPRPPKRGKKIILEQCSWIWRRLDFRWQMILREVFRNRLRTIANTFACAIGAALMMMAFFMRDGMFELVQFQFDRILLSDFDISLRDEHHFGALDEAKRLPGVDFAEPLLSFGCTFHHGHRLKRAGITGLNGNARLTVPRDVQGRKVPIPKVGLLITRKLAEILNVTAGEFVTVVPTQGVREPIRMPVASIVDSYLGLAAYANLEYLNRHVGEEQSLTALQLHVTPEREPVRHFYRQLKQLPGVQAVNAIRDQKHKLVEVLVDQMMISITVIILFAGLIFFGTILNASLISLAERRQEIATFRALGYRSREVGIIFLRESLLLNIVGTLVGLPLGYLLSRLLVQVYNFELFRMPFVIHSSSWLFTIVLGLVFTLVAHIPVQRAINKMPWLQELNVKE